MLRLKQFASEKLHVNPEQVQIFTPTPSTYSSLMYYTELDPFTRRPLFVEKDPRRKEHQKDIVDPQGRHGVFVKTINTKDTKDAEELNPLYHLSVHCGEKG